MPTRVLVAFATKYGSTQEVAETVAASLRDGGLVADVRPAGTVATIGDYGAVVLGAPLYIGSLLKDAHRFLAKHQQALATRPVAVFALGPTHADEGELRGAREQLDKELAKYPWLKPVAVQAFAGKYDPARLRFPDSLLATLPASPLHGQPPSDSRDWPSIRAWAGSLVGLV